MSERLFGEIVLDPEYLNDYLVVKATRIDNRLTGLILFREQVADEAFAKFNKLVQEDPEGIYHLFPPTDNLENRRSLTKGSELI